MTLLHRSLILSGVLLLVAVVLWSWQPRLKFKASLVLIVGVLSCILIQDSAAVLLQTVLIAGLLYCTKESRSTLTFSLEALGISIAIYALLILQSWLNIRQYQEWRERFAFQSLEEGLRLLKTPTVLLSPKAQEEMHEVNWRLNTPDNFYRQMALENLHARTMETFVNAPGFGVRRIIAPPTKKNLMLDQEIVIPQPGSLGDILGGKAVKEGVGPSDDKDLRAFHRDSLLDFVNPRGFGWVKSRAEVAGFQGHFFRAIPKSERWLVRNIELVGLLKHDEPVVYVTANLPRMEEIRTAKTRSLDSFEEAGLKELQQGETLYVDQSTLGLRLLGTIRALQHSTPRHADTRPHHLDALAII